MTLHFSFGENLERNAGEQGSSFRTIYAKRRVAICDQAVSYTHLDVYKRQRNNQPAGLVQDFPLISYVGDSGDL